MRITGLDHYNIRVPISFLQELTAFYTDVLGLRVGFRPAFRSSGYWLYAGDKPLLHLTGFNPDTDSKFESQQTGWFSHVALQCEHLPQAIERLKARGIEYELAEVPHLNQVQIFLRDPAGIGIELNFAAAG
ncbi:MAG: VOC family protein [Gammaproteobacteria bacterium]